MTCEEKWESIEPGSIVRLKDGTRLLRISSFNWFSPTIDLSTGRQGVVGEYMILSEVYTDQFEAEL